MAKRRKLTRAEKRNPSLIKEQTAQAPKEAKPKRCPRQKRDNSEQKAYVGRKRTNG